MGTSLLVKDVCLLYRVEISETAKLGHWSSADDVLARSYSHLPNIETLTRMAGASSAESYVPFHLLISPPRELLHLVLSAFRTAHFQQLEVK